MVSISVIIPTYRPHDYLWQCLDSLCQQTLQLDKFEVLIVLNGDREPYMSEIEDYARQHTALNIEILYSLQAGVSVARNVGIEKSNGKYLCFLDDDDWLSPVFLEELLAKAADDTVVFANVMSYKDSDGCVDEYYISQVFRKTSAQTDCSLLSVRRLCNSACFKLIPRKIILTTRFDTRYKISEDALFMTTLSNRFQKFRFTSPDAIYYRRIRQGSATYRKKPIGQMLKNNVSLILSLIRIYFSDVRRYNLKYFLMQCLGVTKNTLRILLHQ